MSAPEQPSLVTQMVLAEKHGLRLNVEQLASVLDMTPGAILNAISARRFPIPTYVDGKRRYADFRDVAVYLDGRREQARRAALQA